MDSKRAWIGYVVIRVLAFLVPFAVIMIAFPAWQANWLVGLVVGSIVGIAVSYIFLRRQRMRMGEDIAEFRARKDQRLKLDREEDAILDGAQATGVPTDDLDAPDPHQGAEGNDDADANADASGDDPRGRANPSSA